MNTPPATGYKGGGFELRLEAGLIGHSVDYHSLIALSRRCSERAGRDAQTDDL